MTDYIQQTNHEINENHTPSLALTMTSKLPLLTLNNGVVLPALGFGTFAKEGIPRKCYNAVLAALDAGYRHLDCAS